jgi:AraC-like DNA-binding protein
MVIKSYGIDPEPLFRAAGSDFIPPSPMGGKMPFSVLDEVRNTAAELSGDTAFGLSMAKVFHPSHLDSLGFAWLASNNLRDGFSRLERFAAVVNSSASVLVRDIPGGMRVEHQIDVVSLNPRVMFDQAMALTVCLCQLNCGSSFRALKVGLAGPAPRSSAGYRETLTCEPVFNQPRNFLEISEEDANRPHHGANAFIAELHDDLTAKFLFEQGQDFISRVRNAMIRRLPGGVLSLDEVSDDLFMSPRNLRRRLAANQRTFRSLLNDVRRELADVYLVRGAFTMSQVAYMLGFSSQSACSRAYQRWNGVSPSAVRPSYLD